MRITLLTSVVAAALAVPATAAAVPFGGLTQLSGTSGCITSNGSQGCATDALLSPGVADVETSPDGKNVYVGTDSTTMLVYSRDATSGALSRTACFNSNGSSGCTDVDMLGGQINLAISPDGKNVYASSYDNDAIGWFSRNGTSGALTFSSCIQPAGLVGCASISGPSFDALSGLTVSPDGANLYAVAEGSDELTKLSRGFNGSLGNPECFSQVGIPCDQVTELASLTDVQVSPDGANVYTLGGNVVVSFARGAGGNLSQLSGSNGCISEAGAPCAQAHDLTGATQINPSPDGRNLYVAARTDDAVSVLARAASGGLSQSAGTGGCLSSSSAGCTPAVGLDGAESVVTSADGKNVYAGADSAIAIFDRSISGQLSQPASPFGCVSQAGGGCTAARALNDLVLSVSPGGNSVYSGAGLGALGVFARQLPPTCSNTQGTLPNTSVASIALPCSDPNGDALSRSIVSPPARGVLDPINQVAGSVGFTPTSRYHGSDSFTFNASDGSLSSNTATAAISLTDRIGPLVSFGKQKYLRLSKAGSTKVLLKCPSSEVDGCPNGRLQIKSSAAINITLKKKRKARVTLGSSRFNLAAGQQRYVKVKFNRKSRNALKRLRNVRVNLTATSRDPGANTGKATKATRIKAPGKKRRR